MGFEPTVEIFLIGLTARTFRPTKATPEFWNEHPIGLEPHLLITNQVLYQLSYRMHEFNYLLSEMWDSNPILSLVGRCFAIKLHFALKWRQLVTIQYPLSFNQVHRPSLLYLHYKRGRWGIRTLGPRRISCFQDKCNKPTLPIFHFLK